jgi:DNA-binding transcriptional regulator GbsR (MarR family)
MEIKEAKDKFIQLWGTLAGNWGINRTMAQIHSLLLISSKPMCTEEIMEELNISRGNANMNIRALIDWGLVQKEHKAGDRKEYFNAEKDLWEIARRIMAMRKKKEIEPMIKILDQVEEVEGDKDDAEIKAFRDSVQNLKKFMGQIDSISDKFIRTEQGFIFNTLLKLLK